jgi:hypothetical protein
LDSITGKNMKKWVDGISKIVQRRQNNEVSGVIKLFFTTDGQGK